MVQLPFWLLTDVSKNGYQGRFSRGKILLDLNRGNEFVKLFCALVVEGRISRRVDTPKYEMGLNKVILANFTESPKKNECFFFDKKI